MSKKKIGRKKRKQKRKQKHTVWLTDTLDGKIRKVANKLMWAKWDKAQNLPLHHRFFCNDCKKLYCLNQSGEVVYCKKCPLLKENWTACSKKVRDNRSCGCN